MYKCVFVCLLCSAPTYTHVYNTLTCYYGGHLNLPLALLSAHFALLIPHPLVLHERPN